jgi:hypothetical protein
MRRPDKMEPNPPKYVRISGKVDDGELDFIKEAFKPIGIKVERSLNKAHLIDETIRLVFSDFNAVDYIRDSLLGTVHLAILKRILDYFKTKRRQDCETSFNKIITYNGKSFTVYITCHYNHISTIPDQINLILTPFVLDNIPTGSLFYATGQEDQTVKITVVERGTGKQYRLM